MFGDGTFAATVGAHTIALAPGSQANGFTFNDYPIQIGAHHDQLTLIAADAGVSFRFELTGVDPLGQWLATDAWPIDVAAVLSTAPSAFFEIVGADFDAEGTLSYALAPLDSVTQEGAETATPEPSTVLLFGTGAVMVSRRLQGAPPGARPLR